MIYGVDYLRLSKEDEREGESGSISNQRKIIQQYCASHGIMLVKEFVDDDYSGGNFNRPGFQAMITFLKANTDVRTVITKDLSRLGRDMSESSYYAERYFPEHNIHYLAIDDSFDSEKENMLAPFQFAMNDMYLRDVSKKVKNALHVMMDHGEYCFMAPYGYRKENSDLHHLVPDEATAPVVQDIFSMAAHGESVFSIASKLNARGIDPPLKYRVKNIEGANSGNTKYMTDSWNPMTIRRMLKNPVYLGHTVLGKTKKVSPKSEIKRPVPKSDWRITEGTHEALVDPLIFETAGEGLSRRSQDFKKYDHVRKSIFGGIAFCATCGAAMCSSGTVYNGEREKYWYLTCQNIPARSKHKCTNGARIKYSTLVDIVSEDLRSIMSLSEEQRKSAVKRAIESERASSRVKEEEAAAISIESRLATIEQVLTKLYEDMYTDVVPRERALSLIQKYDDETRELNEKLSSIRTSIAKTRDVGEEYRRFFTLADRIARFETLDRSTLLHFVERIEIGPRTYTDGQKHGSRSKVPFEQEIRIIYRFIGEGSFEKAAS